MRRLAVLIFLLTSACTNSSDDFDLIRDTIFPNQAGFTPRFQALLSQQPPVLQVALLDLELSSNVLLESRRDGIETWLTPDGAAFILDRGMLVGTRGFGEGLLASDVSEPLAAVVQGREGLTERFHTYLTGDDDTVTRTYRCLIENRGSRDVTIQGASVPTRLMAEDCRSLDQAFVNLYWVREGDGRFVQTRQWSGEFLGVILTKVVP